MGKLEHQGDLTPDAGMESAQPAQLPLPSHGAGSRVLAHYLKTNKTPDAHVVAHVLKDFPGDQLEMFRLLHRGVGNAFVQDVLAAMASKPQPQPSAPATSLTAASATVTATPVEVETTPAQLDSQLELQPVPDVVLPSYAAAKDTARDAPDNGAVTKDGRTYDNSRYPKATADEAAAAEHNDLMTPEVFHQFEETARTFIVQRFQLTPEEGAALVFSIGHRFEQGPVIGGSFNMQVDNLPHMTMPKPKSAKSPVENDYNSNFYTDLPKGMRPPGKGKTAHVMLNEQPVGDGRVAVGGTIRIHFDIGNPSEFKGILQHIFVDNIYGHINQVFQGKHVQAIK